MCNCAYPSDMVSTLPAYTSRPFYRFLLELAAPWLLLAPVRPVRQVGVLCQIPLQLGIMATGNYNWFNLHTCVLLLPAWDADVDMTAVPIQHAGQLLAAPLRAWCRMWESRTGRVLGYMAALVALGGGAARFFSLDVADHARPSLAAPNAIASQLRLLLTDPAAARLHNHATPDATASMLAVALGPAALTYLYAALALSGVVHACSLPADSSPLHTFCFAWRALLSVAAAVWLGVTLLPFECAWSRLERFDWDEKTRKI